MRLQRKVLEPVNVHDGKIFKINLAVAIYITGGTATVMFLTIPRKCLRDATFTLKCITLTTFQKVERGTTPDTDALTIYTELVIRKATIAAESVLA